MIYILLGNGLAEFNKYEKKKKNIPTWAQYREGYI